MVRYVTFTLASVAAVHVFLCNVPAKYSSSGEEHPFTSMLVTVEAEGVCHATWEILLKKSGVIVLFLVSRTNISSRLLCICPVPNFKY